MDFPIIDFDPHEDLVFPPQVEQKYTSREFMAHIAAYEPADGKTALWHLGQNCWILKGPRTPEGKGKLVCIDPYLTDFAASKRTRKRLPKSRLLPVFVEPEDLQADVVVITHSHIDHADPFTLERLNIKHSAKFLTSWQTLKVLTDAGIPTSRQLLMHPLQAATVEGIEFTGTFAEPTDFTDLNHMGFVMRFPGGKVYYNSGDTAKTALLEHVRSFHPEVMSICINGGYHNLSHWEAAELTALVHPKVVLPAHFDMMPHNLQSPHMFRKSLYEKTKTVQYHRVDYYTAFEF